MSSEFVVVISSLVPCSENCLEKICRPIIVVKEIYLTVSFFVNLYAGTPMLYYHSFDRANIFVAYSLLFDSIRSRTESTDIPLKYRIFIVARRLLATFIFYWNSSESFCHHRNFLSLLTTILLRSCTTPISPTITSFTTFCHFRYICLEAYNYHLPWWLMLFPFYLEISFKFS